MFKKASLSELMREELPNLAHQKRLCYRTDYNEVVFLYRLLNKKIFNNRLQMPIIEVAPRCRKYWGYCFGDTARPPNRRSYCKIKLMDKWWCRQWLIITLAHEMCHQYQWDIIGEQRLSQGKDRLMSHGPSFYIFRDKLAKYGIPIKVAHSKKKWFKTQDFFKC